MLLKNFENKIVPIYVAKNEQFSLSTLSSSLLGFQVKTLLLQFHIPQNKYNDAVNVTLMI